MTSRSNARRSFRFAVLLLSSTALTGVALAADWTGVTSSDWYNGVNWSTGTVPATGVDVNVNTESPNPAVINGGTAAAGAVNIGPTAIGSLAINNGAVLNTSGDVLLGTTGFGILSVDGSGTQLNLAAGKRLDVGNAGSGLFTISNSATVTDDSARVGSTAGLATATLSNAGIWNSAALTVSSQASTAAVLNVGTASHIFSATGEVGMNGNGTAIISDANSTWIVSNQLVIGDNGTGVVTVQNGGLIYGASTTVGGSLNAAPSTGNGTLAITSGGHANDANFDVGLGNGYTGTVTVDGAGSQINSNSNMTIGDTGGTGTVTVTNGGALSLVGLDLGEGANATGTLTLDHSTLAMTGFLEVGEGGSGTIMVQNAGTMTGASTILGAAANGSATLTFTGTGTTGTFSSTMDVGYAVSASLNVLAGAQLVSQSGVVGDNGSGTALVDGPGSSWTMAHTLDLGDNLGAGTLTVSNGGSVHSDDEVDIGTLAAGTVTVTDANSSLSSGSNIEVGFVTGGSGALSVLNGGLVTATNNIYIGPRDAAGTVTVDGVGSQLLVTNGVLHIGGQHSAPTDGNGTLNVTGGGAVAAKTIDLAETLASTGTLTVDGIGSVVTVGSGDTDIGEYGNGTLTVSNHGAFNGAAVTLGLEAGSQGTLTLSGGASLNATNVLAGFMGTGTVSVLSGASIGSAEGLVGVSGGESSTATVDGAGSLWTATSGFVVGDANGATGTLTITNGGAVASQTLFIIGALNGANGTATVDGAGSELGANTDLEIGGTSLFPPGGGTGTLNVTGHALAVANNIFLGHATGGNGTVIVDGDGSTLLAYSTVGVGDASGATGTLTVRNGGALNFSFLDIAGDSTSTGTVSITDSGTSATGSDLFVGDKGTGTLSVLNGAVLSDFDVDIGAGGTGTATADGSGTNWTTRTSFLVGDQGDGTLTVSNSASFVSGDFTMGVHAGVTGTATVTGPFSALSSTGAVIIGDQGTGTLILTDGGTFAAANGVTVAAQTGSFGQIYIGSKYPAAPAAPGTLDTPTVTLGAGDAGIIFNHTSANYVFAPVIAGSGVIATTAGTTILTADSSGFTGSAELDGGTLLVNGILGGNGAAVLPGATLGGSGTVMGQVLVADGGNLQGVEGQTLTIGQSLSILGNTSNINVTLGAPGGAGLFNVAQNLTLDGVLNITAAPGFDAGVYRLIDYGGALTDNGLDIGTTPSGTVAGDFVVQTSVAGQVNLVNSHASILSFWDGAGAGNANNGAVDGGNGTWSVTAPNWTNISGQTNGAMVPQPGFAVFEGAPGIVTVDNSAGAVGVTGMQFASSGYTVTGDAVTLASGEADIRVGDGTAAGAGYTATIASVLTGDGTLTKTDLGTLILTGENTYTGGTDIDAGVLQIGNGGTSGSITGDINENGTLVFDRSDVVNFNNRIFSNNAIVIQAGTGTTILRDTETYSGQTIVAAGTLQGTALSFGSSSILDNATLVIDQATDAEFANAISGTGNFIKQGAGALSLTGASAFAGTTDIEQGTLQIGNGGTTGSITGAITDNSVLAFNHSDALDVSGSAISGTGSVVQAGTGTTTLSASNSYTGGTVIAAGTLVGGAGSFGTGAIQDNAALIVSQATDADFANAISGSGTFTKQGAGSLNLTSANTYTGGTDIEQGTLQIGNGGTTGSITGGITDNSVLAFNRSDALDVSGSTISGTGSVVQAGTGITTLSASNSYTGGTVIAVGTLVGGAGSFGTGAIQDNAALVISQATDADFANAISGTGTFTKQGAGSLNLTGANTLTGSTVVAAGRLAVNGSLGSVVTVQNGATLGGNGTVGGVAAQSGGIVAPGNSIGTLNVAGDYAQASGSVYQVQVTSTGQADRINVAGNATIANGAILNVTKTDAAAYGNGTHDTVLTAGGSLTGTFTLTGDTSIGLFTGLVAQNDAHNVYLVVGKNKSFASAGSTPNQIAAAGGADALPVTAPLSVALTGLPTIAAAQAAFDQISGEAYASARTALIDDSRFPREAALGRLNTALESGDTGSGRPSLWGQVYGAWGSNDATGNAAALGHSSRGVLGGVDLPVNDTWRVGALAGYSRGSFNVKDRTSSGASDDYHLGAYAGTQQGAVAVQFGAAYSWHDLTVGRTVNFAGFNDALNAQYNAGTTQAFADLGYHVQAGKVDLEPFADLAYISLQTGGFAETGGAAALTATGNTENVTFTTLGLRGKYDIALGDTNIGLHGNLGWRHAFGDLTPGTALSFAGGSAFAIQGVPLAQDEAAFGAGFDLSVAKSLLLGFSYDGQEASNAKDNTVKMNLNWNL